MKKLIIPLLLSVSSISVSQASTELSTKIVNGTETSVQNFPDFVSLFYDRAGFGGNSGSHSLCGGTLLNSQYVLTAAHCLYQSSSDELDKDRLIYYSVGQSDTDDDSTLSTIETVRATDYYVKDFKNTVTELWPNDLAIVKLKSPLNLSGKVTRADNEADYRSVDKKFIAIGHGDTKQGSSSYKLLQAPLTYVDNVSCVDSFSSLGSKLTEHQLCFSGEVGSTVDDSGNNLRNGICSGDSGGPVYWERSSGDYVQVGVTSFGPSNCGAGIGNALVTSVFTEIADYKDWINSVLAGNETPVFSVSDKIRECYYQAGDQLEGCTSSDSSDQPAEDNSINSDSQSSENAATTSKSSGGSFGYILLLGLAGVFSRRRFFN